jgi:SPP1 gp7 family putative phage head morphogenesis protein
MSTPFWKSDVGIAARIEMLAEQVIWQTFNHALKAYAGESGVKQFEWVTEIDVRTCNYCDAQSGRRYRIGQFMPEIPCHIFCRCHWDVVIQG